MNDASMKRGGGRKNPFEILTFHPGENGLEISEGRIEKAERRPASASSCQARLKATFSCSSSFSHSVDELSPYTYICVGSQTRNSRTGWRAPCINEAMMDG
jgi:hypothetical protein